MACLAPFLGDKSHSVIFDNSKLRQIVPEYCATIPFPQGVHEIIEWYDEEPSRQVADEDFNELNDVLIERIAELQAAQS